MKLINMAEALGEEISNSNEYVRFIKAQTKYMEDENAKELINRFKRKQKVLEFLEIRDEASEAERIRKEINELFNSIEKNEVIQELNDSLDKFLIIKQSVYEKVETFTHISEEILSLNKNCGGCKRKCGGCK